MKRLRPATLTLAALVVTLVGCATTSSLDNGNAMYRDGQYVAAKDAYTEAIAANPKSVAAWNNRAAARLHAGDVNGAIADYNRALELAPYDADVYYNRGNALMTAGLYREAIGDYTRATETNAYYAKAFFNRGSAYAMLGQRDAAQSDWSHAVALEPDPFARAAMQRATGIEPTPVVAIATSNVRQPAVASAPAPGTRSGAVGLPSERSPVAGTPPVPPAASPVLSLPAQSTSPEPAASVQTLDARALAARAVTRQLDGDHVGAMHDLRTAMSMEPDAGRRAALADLIRRLDTPR